jgi:hypothetical protein
MLRTTVRIPLPSQPSLYSVDCQGCWCFTRHYQYLCVKTSTPSCHNLSRRVFLPKILLRICRFMPQTSIRKEVCQSILNILNMFPYPYEPSCSQGRCTCLLGLAFTTKKSRAPTKSPKNGERIIRHHPKLTLPLKVILMHKDDVGYGGNEEQEQRDVPGEHGILWEWCWV